MAGVVVTEAQAKAKAKAKAKPAPKQEEKDTKKAEPEAVDTKALSAFLVKPAEEAKKARKYGLAISLYRGILAIRGDGDEIVWDLADVWALAGEHDSAIEELERYKAAVGDPNQQVKAEQKIGQLKGLQAGFGGNVFTVDPASKESAEAFRRGRDFYKKKKYASAILMFKAGIVLDPATAGNFRELGASYDALGRSAEANDFFVRYLKLRPFGKNADEVRARLTKVGLVGKVSVETSFPCDQVWMNRQPLPPKMKLPIKDFVLAPGRYKLLCVNAKYHFGQFITAEVQKGGATKVLFAWAILEIKLDPWGRVVLENPYDTKQMNDIGHYSEIGVPVPDDRRSLKMKITAGDGSKSKDVLVKIEPGKKIPITWE